MEKIAHQITIFKIMKMIMQMHMHLQFLTFAEVICKLIL